MAISWTMSLGFMRMGSESEVSTEAFTFGKGVLRSYSMCFKDILEILRVISGVSWQAWSGPRSFSCTKLSCSSIALCMGCREHARPSAFVSCLEYKKCSTL